MRRHRMLARVTCSRRCIVAAVATVSMPGARPFVVRSKSACSRAGARRRGAAVLARAATDRCAASTDAHESIQASVVGQVVDSGGNVEASTGAQTLQITR